jgi:ubiquinone biosynthesis accessory factor UbiJ
MATASPFPQVSTLLETVFSRLPAPPAWLQDEVVNRVVLLINHVLMGEQEAMLRLARQSGRSLALSWRSQVFVVRITPVGLVEHGVPASAPDLRIVVQSTDVLVLASDWVSGRKPDVRIDGDVQLAADINWLVDHVRWDIEEDLAKVLGDVPAHTLMTLVRSAGAALRRFAPTAPASAAAGVQI